MSHYVLYILTVRFTYVVVLPKIPLNRISHDILITYYILNSAGSYSFHIGGAVLLVQKFNHLSDNFFNTYLIKTEISIGAALQQALIVSQIFGVALQQLQHHR